MSTLVSIYDSKDVIVKELQNLFAQKLLAVRDYELEKEVGRSCARFETLGGRHADARECSPSQIRTIEILKLRFGEAALQVCEVMLKDLADSKRINQRINAAAEVRSLRLRLVPLHCG